MLQPGSELRDEGFEFRPSLFADVWNSGTLPRMDTQMMAAELAAQATKMEQQAEAMRKAAAILAPTNGAARRGRPPGSKNKPKPRAKRQTAASASE